MAGALWAPAVGKAVNTAAHNMAAVRISRWNRKTSLLCRFSLGTLEAFTTFKEILTYGQRKPCNEHASLPFDRGKTFDAGTIRNSRHWTGTATSAGTGAAGQSW
jgi:hypothetical protein